MKTHERLNQLNPDEKTVGNYKEVEVLSLGRIKEMLKEPNRENQEIAKISHKLLQTVNKLRTNLKSEVGLHIKLFHDVSADKNELKAYVEASYPKVLKK